MNSAFNERIIQNNDIQDEVRKSVRFQNRNKQNTPRGRSDVQLNREVNVLERSDNVEIETNLGSTITTTEGEMNQNSDISVITTESLLLNQIKMQSEYYQSNEQEEMKEDTWNTMKKYIKKIYSHAKFLSDTGKSFKEPNFVVTDGVRSQSVEICEILWKKLGKYYYILKIIKFQ